MDIKERTGQSTTAIYNTALEFYSYTESMLFYVSYDFSDDST